MKVYIIQSKNKMMNINASIKNYMFGVLPKVAMCEILEYVIANVVRHEKFMNM